MRAAAELIHPAGEQLGQMRLGAVHPEALQQHISSSGEKSVGLSLSSTRTGALSLGSFVGCDH